MPALAIVAMVGLAAVLVLVCAALVEVFRQLNDLREVTQLDDRPTPLTLPRDALAGASAIPLPGELAETPVAAVVVLSPDCATCITIAQDLGGQPLPTVWFTVAGEDHGESRVRRSLAGQGDRLVAGLGDALRDRLGLDVAPAVVVFDFGKVRHAFAVGSTRQVNALVPTVFELRGARDSLQVTAHG
jgi:hypothetical protein